MKNFSIFYFKKFEFNTSSLQAIFNYSFDNEVFFEEKIDFKNESFDIKKDFNLDKLNDILFHLHIALWISYYKLFPTKDLVIESWFLDDFQIKFWKKFYINWLWEFLYTNKILPKELFNFVNNKKQKKDFYLNFENNNNWKNENFKNELLKNNNLNFKTGWIENNDIKIEPKLFKNNKALVAIWWGKDSIVSIELLKKSWIDFDLFVFWKIDELKQFTAQISSKKILLVKRTLSQNLFELNNQWYYNWHVPITWIIAFVLEIVAYLYSYKYLVLSNEKSANFWNTTWEWVDINHQYSKSLDFEKDFWEYVSKYISKEIKYFSLLRWLYEIKIVELFSKYWKKYFWYFSSCNNNFKILWNSSLWNVKKSFWCNNCPKCAFVFSILRPYLNRKEIIKIFWEDLFERSDLEKLFRELLWISWIKPFECVWEAEEVIYSMYLTIKNHYNDKKLPFILDIFNKEVLYKMTTLKLKNIEKKLVTIYNEDIIPAEIKNNLFQKI